jgi:xanthine dehydrogenase small subunit
VSSTPIRNIATLAGNFVNASPIGDMTIFFMALDAVLVLKNGKNRREIALKDFYKGYKMIDKMADEIIEKFYFELPTIEDFFHFEKVCKRTHLDIASVNSAIFLRINEAGLIDKARLAFGGVAPIPLFLPKTSAYLLGKYFDESTVMNANQVLQNEIAPISDVRGSEHYKRLLARQLLLAHSEELRT